MQVQAPVWGLQTPSWAHWQLALQLKPQVPGGQGTEQLPRCQPGEGKQGHTGCWVLGVPALCRELGMRKALKTLKAEHTQLLLPNLATTASPPGPPVSSTPLGLLFLPLHLDHQSLLPYLSFHNLFDPT